MSKMLMRIAPIVVLLAMLTTGCAIAPVPTAAPPPTATLAILPTQQALAAVTPTSVPTSEPSVTPTLAPSLTPVSPQPTATAPLHIAGPTAPPTRAVTAIPTVKPTSTRAPVPSPGMMTVKLFFVALEDNGKSGKMIGCQDSVVAVNRSIPETSAPLTAALKELLSVRTQYYGASGLYNALYQSNLKVAEISITSGTATIKLTGTYALGGVCDGPRFVAQIQEIALQFSTVKQVVVFINGKPLDQILSGKG